LREEDKKAEYYNEKKIMPLNERIFYAYIKSLTGDAVQGNEEAKKALKLFVDTLLNNESIKKYKFANYHLASACIVVNKKDAAFRYAKAFVRSNILKSWAWKLLAGTVQENDKQLSFLCKAVELVKNEPYLLGVRAQLTNALLQKGYQLAASENTNIEIKTRVENNWNIPETLLEKKETQWYRFPSDNNTLNKVVQKYASLAIKNLFPEATETKAIVTGCNNKTVFLFSETGDEFKIRKYTKVEAGEWYSIITADGKLLDYHKAGTYNSCSGNIQEFYGKLNLLNNFGFINNTYIPSFLITKNKLKTGNEYKGIAIFTEDKKKNKKGWKAIKIITR
jgi:hypothetical protein